MPSARGQYQQPKVPFLQPSSASSSGAQKVGEGGVGSSPSATVILSPAARSGSAAAQPPPQRPVNHRRSIIVLFAASISLCCMFFVMGGRGTIAGSNILLTPSSSSMADTSAGGAAKSSSSSSSLAGADNEQQQSSLHHQKSNAHHHQHMPYYFPNSPNSNKRDHRRRRFDILDFVDDGPTKQSGLLGSYFDYNNSNSNNGGAGEEKEDAIEQRRRKIQSLMLSGDLRSVSIDPKKYLVYNHTTTSKSTAAAKSSSKVPNKLPKKCDLSNIAQIKKQKNWKLRDNFNAEQFCAMFPQRGIVKGTYPTGTRLFYPDDPFRRDGRTTNENDGVPTYRRGGTRRSVSGGEVDGGSGGDDGSSTSSPLPPDVNWDTSPLDFKNEHYIPIDPNREREKPHFVPLRARRTPARLIYGMLFGVEFDVLDLVLHEIFPIVDDIVIIESGMSHSLKPKETVLWKAFDKEAGPFYDRFKRYLEPTSFGKGGGGGGEGGGASPSADEEQDADLPPAADKSARKLELQKRHAPRTFANTELSKHYNNKVHTYTFVPRKRYQSGWDIEKRQRQVMMWALTDIGVKDGDIVIANMDMDELMSAATLMKLKYCMPDNTNDRLPAFHLAHFRYHFDCLQEVVFSRYTMTVFPWSAQTAKSNLYLARKSQFSMDYPQFVCQNERRYSEVQDEPSNEFFFVQTAKTNLREVSYEMMKRASGQLMATEALNEDINIQFGSLAWHMSTFGGIDILKFKRANSPHRFVDDEKGADALLQEQIDTCYFNEAQRLRFRLWAENVPLLLRSVDSPCDFD